jgi:hypothetical protein
MIWFMSVQLKDGNEVSKSFMRKKQATSILCVWTILIGTMNGLMWMLNLSIMAADLTLHGNKLMTLLVHPKCLEVAIFLGHPVAM